MSLLGAAYGSVSDIEIFWTLMALAGGVLSGYNLKESWEDMRVLRAHNIEDGRWLIARYSFRAELARLIIQSINFTIGVFAMTFPEPPPTTEPLKTTIFRFLFTWGFITSASLLALKSYWNFSLRRNLRRSLKRNAGQSVEGKYLEKEEANGES
jgi:hypothetical protein